MREAIIEQILSNQDAKEKLANASLLRQFGLRNLVDQNGSLSEVRFKRVL